MNHRIDEDLSRQARLLKQMGIGTNQIADMLCISYDRARYAVMTDEQRAREPRSAQHP